MAKDNEPLNRPFAKLKGLKIKKADKIQDQSCTAIHKDKTAALNDKELLGLAMKGVTPIRSDYVTPEPVDARDVVGSIRESIRRQDSEVIDALNALTKGRSHFDITCTGEYMEGHVIPLDPGILKKLKAGEFSTQAHLDLHGCTKEEARSALGSFLANAHAMGHKSLLVIHGRGLKSSDGPVLKEFVARWLTTGTLSHLVLAFCSARPCDGGTGALYILLRKRPKKAPFKKLL
ncbi:MAG TPA: DNA mismatch repair protein MutS [Deltaproteobacteria bacterium]|nr:DNA mismatch repair protein MutS [Deltaproteobacteria bacterium]